MTVHFGRCETLEVIVPSELVEKIGQIDGVVRCVDFLTGNNRSVSTIWYVPDVITKEELTQALRAL